MNEQMEMNLEQAQNEECIVTADDLHAALTEAAEVNVEIYDFPLYAAPPVEDDEGDLGTTIAKIAIPVAALAVTGGVAWLKKNKVKFRSPIVTEPRPAKQPKGEKLTLRERLTGRKAVVQEESEEETDD